MKEAADIEHWKKQALSHPKQAAPAR
jgi:hypothetical protein